MDVTREHSLQFQRVCSIIEREAFSIQTRVKSDFRETENGYGGSKKGDNDS
jgi:hypothetical protein